MKGQKKPTRDQKKKNPNTQRNSKYALKVQRRRKVCSKVGMKDTPYPVLWYMRAGGRL